MTNIFAYTSYRRYLEDFFREKKSANKRFSYRVFNEKAGISSPSFFKLVVAGDRNLAGKSTDAFIKALGLTPREAQFFRVLVRFNQAKSLDEREQSFRQMAFFREFDSVKTLDAHQYRFYEKWYHAAILEMTRIKGFRQDPHWIATHLHPRISDEEAQESLALLKELGLVTFGKNLRPIARNKNITTEKEVYDLAVAAFQSEMIRQADSNLWGSSGDDRDISSVTVAIDENGFLEAKRRIQEFRRELNVLLSGTKNPDRVYQINFQLFNLTELPPRRQK